MGLIGLFLQPMLLGAPLHLMSAQRFQKSPRLWLDVLSEEGINVTGAPNFAFGVAARLLSDRHRLSHLRVVYNGSEPISPDTVSAFSAAAKAHGFRPDAMFCVYGMAESTLATTFPHPGDGVRLSRCEGLDETYVSVGSALPHLEVRVGSPDDHGIGEVQLRGRWVTAGYYDQGVIEPVRQTDDGWFRTRDLGFLSPDDRQSVGRADDMLIVGGRNLAPTTVERAAESVEGVHKNNVAAFAVRRDGRDRVVVVAETDDGVDRDAVAKNVFAAVLERTAVYPFDIVLLGRGDLPKTSSGKVQRRECSRRYTVKSRRT
jgi:fatty-acyl-CoA synthase